MTRLMLSLFCFFCPTGLSAAQIFSGSDSYARLGSGLDSASNQWRAPCLDGVIIPTRANRSLNFKVHVSESAGEILEDQRGFGSAQVDFFVVGAKARSEFLLRNSESTTQSSVIWSIEYRGDSVVFGQRALNARGLNAAAASADEQRRLCGDQFIMGAALGARFYLAASLVFETEEKYRYFKTKVSASAFGGLLKKQKTSIDEVRQIAQGAHLSVQAFQYGGQTFDLDLLAATQVSYCSMEKIDPCLERFAAFQRYAFGPDGFRTHVDAAKPEQMAVLWLNASPYQDAGHFLRTTPDIGGMDPGFVSLSEQLFTRNQAVQQAMARTNAVIGDDSRPSAERDEARLRLSQLQSQADAIQGAAALCGDQNDYQACKSRLDVINAMVASP